MGPLRTNILEPVLARNGKRENVLELRKLLQARESKRMQGEARASRKSKAKGAKARSSSNQSSRTKSRTQRIAIPSKDLDKQL